MEPKTDPNATIIRLLSTGAIISSAAFAKENPVRQTEILALAAGKPIAFVENFCKLSDPKLLTQKLLAGDDVSMELEFNSIEITDAENAALVAIRPLLKRINKLKSSNYPWLSSEILDAARRNLNFFNNGVRRNGYTLTKAQTKRLWNVYAPWMLGKTDKPTIMTMVIRYNRHNITFRDNGTIRIGCQDIPRADAEAAFRHFKFDEK